MCEQCSCDSNKETIAIPQETRACCPINGSMMGCILLGPSWGTMHGRNMHILVVYSSLLVKRACGWDLLKKERFERGNNILAMF